MRSFHRHLAAAKTSEILMLGSDVGIYMLRLLTGVDLHYVSLFMKLTRLCKRTQHKVSTPGDREWLKINIPLVMTALEIVMPVWWNTLVIHYFTFHTVQILEAIGPFCALNMMDYERFHTQFKKLATSTKDIMTSIKNSWQLKDAAMQNRMTQDVEWSSLPARATPAGLAIRPDSAVKTDRMVEALGQPASSSLNNDELQQIQDLWAIDNVEYDRFRDKFRRARIFKRKRKGSKAKEQAAQMTLENWEFGKEALGNDGRQAERQVNFRRWQRMQTKVKVHDTHFTCHMYACILYRTTYAWSMTYTDRIPYVMRMSYVRRVPYVLCVAYSGRMSYFMCMSFLTSVRRCTSARVMPGICFALQRRKQN
jgi:hypothetical protein